MRRTEWLQETRKMRFEEAYEGWQARRLAQEEAARLLGVCERTFRRYLDRYEEAGLEGLIDKRLEQVSQRRAPMDEVLAMTERYRRRHLGWNVKHFYAWYRREGGGRSYSWVKNTLTTTPNARQRCNFSLTFCDHRWRLVMDLTFYGQPQNDPKGFIVSRPKGHHALSCVYATLVSPRRREHPGHPLYRPDHLNMYPRDLTT